MTKLKAIFEGELEYVEKKCKDAIKEIDEDYPEISSTFFTTKAISNTMTEIIIDIDKLLEQDDSKEINSKIKTIKKAITSNGGKILNKKDGFLESRDWSESQVRSQNNSDKKYEFNVTFKNKEELEQCAQKLFDIGVEYEVYSNLYTENFEITYKVVKNDFKKIETISSLFNGKYNKEKKSEVYSTVHLDEIHKNKEPEERVYKTENQRDGNDNLENLNYTNYTSRNTVEPNVVVGLILALILIGIGLVPYFIWGRWHGIIFLIMGIISLLSCLIYIIKNR